MESAQLVLNFLIYIIWYSFLILFMLDFLVWTAATMQRAEMRSKYTEVEMPSSHVKLEIPVGQSELQPHLQPKSQWQSQPEFLAPSIPDPWFESFKELPNPQKLQAVAVATATTPAPEGQFPNKRSKGTKSTSVRQLQSFFATSEAIPPRLTFTEVCIEFANQGMALEKYRSGHYCYRIIFGYHSPCRFKTLQEARDWLANDYKPMPAAQSVESC